MALDSNTSLQVQSFNVGLAHSFVPHAKDRLPLIIESLKKQPSDILCLQEVWTKNDREAITEALKTIYPHSFYQPIKQKYSQNSPTCQLNDLVGQGKLANCLMSECRKQKGKAFTDCVLIQCNSSLSQLKKQNRDCASGLMSLVGKNIFLGVTTLLNPFDKSGLFAYEGGTGLLLLSKTPLNQKTTLDLSSISTLTRRAALKAQISWNNKDIQLGCTHLTANLGDKVPYMGRFKSWGEENLQQTKLLIQSFQERPLPTLLMGDFNCSTKVPLKDIQQNFASSCSLLQRSFQDPANLKLAQCTHCKNNLLYPKNSKTSSYILDHIFVRSLEVQKSEITQNEEKTIVLKNKQKKAIHLSDHFGVKLLIK